MRSLINMNLFRNMCLVKVESRFICSSFTEQKGCYLCTLHHTKTCDPHNLGTNVNCRCNTDKSGGRGARSLFLG